MAYQDFPDWQSVIRSKSLIFDSDAIISILSFQAEDLLPIMLSLGASFHYTNPVLLELRGTESPKEQLQRNTFLTKYQFTELPMTITELQNASRIQRSLPIGIKGRPSPTDYYLGGTLARYHHGNAFLLSSNLKDFPQPIFTREAFIPLINQTDFKAISVIGLNQDKLVD